MQDPMEHEDLQDSGSVPQKDPMVPEMLGYKGSERLYFPSLFLH